MKINITLITFIIIIIVILIPPAFAQTSFSQINQKVCDKFEEDVSKMAAIMDQLKDRKGIKETRVAFGGSDTPIKQADYWVNFAAEAIAFQRVQKYSSKNELRLNLEVLKKKLLQAKSEVRKVLVDVQ